MSRTHEELVPLAPAYVLGALDADERRAFEEHVALCAACAAEVRTLAPIATGLGQTVPQLSPRPELRSRLLTTVGANPIPRATAIAPAPRRTTASPVTIWLPYAAVLALAAALAVYAWDQRAQMRDLDARFGQSDAGARAAERELAAARRVALEAQTAIAVLTAPDLARIDLAGQPAAPQASARALWSRQRGMVFTATNLPPLAAGRVYQVWIVTDAAYVSAGLLTPDPAGGGTAMFATAPDIAAPTAVAVTIEPQGGVPTPTAAPVLVGVPSATG